MLFMLELPISLLFASGPTLLILQSFLILVTCQISFILQLHKDTHFLRLEKKELHEINGCSFVPKVNHNIPVTLPLKKRLASVSPKP